MRSTQFIFIVLLIFAPHSTAWAMYKCVDSSGKTRFTDILISESCTPMNLGKEVRVRVSDKTTFRTGTIRKVKNRRSGKFETYINFYGVRYNIDPHLIRAVIRTESGFNPKAVSKKGAQGLMQLMPGTAREMKVKDPFDPKQNIEGGTRYLRSLLTTFSGNMQLALAAYNAGPTVVKKQRRIPRIRETEQYVKKVLKYYRDYKSGRA